MFFVLLVKSWNLLVFKDLFTEHLLLPVGAFWLPGTRKEVKTREGHYHVQETHTNEISTGKEGGARSPVLRGSGKRGREVTVKVVWCLRSHR